MNNAQDRSKDEHASESPSRLIDARITELGDWRCTTLPHVRTIIKAADPDIVEEWKWVTPTSPGTPVWSHDGIIRAAVALNTSRRSAAR